MAIQDREQITTGALGEASHDLNQHLISVLNNQGYGTFASRHEILGVLTEEVHEVIEAVQRGTLEDVKQELLDVAQVCLFGVACINSGAVDW